MKVQAQEITMQARSGIKLPLIKKKAMIKFLILLFCLKASISWAVTPAGTSIIDLPAEMSYGLESQPNSGRVRSDEVRLAVSQIYGIDLKPGPLRTFSGLTGIGTACYYPCSIENKGNGRQKISLEIMEKTEDLSVELLMDSNGDGIHQEEEDQAISENRVWIDQDTDFKFFIKLEVQDTAREGLYSASLRVSTTPDGGRYKGDNNKEYGDLDERETRGEIDLQKEKDYVDFLLDLKVSKTVAYPDDVLTYTITCGNMGQDTAEGVTVKNELPKNTDFIWASGLYSAKKASPAYRLDGREKIIKWGEEEGICLNPGEIRQLTVEAKVDTRISESIKLEDKVTLSWHIPKKHSITLKVKALSSLLQLPESLKDVVVYPNPFKEEYSKTWMVHFFNLTKRCRLEVYNIAGELVFTANKDDLKNIYDWNLKNNRGESVASGVYIYYLKNSDRDGDEAIGKLSIIR
ncbi:MAG: gliding motility-associated C-terminal domain-containing protein [bacterium]